MMVLQHQGGLRALALTAFASACIVLTLFGPGGGVVPQALAAEGDLSAPKPYIMYCDVQAYNTPGNPTRTAVDVGVADPEGSVPTTIQSVTVSGPNGFYYGFVYPADYWGSGEYWQALAGEPVDGQYTFTVTNTKGYSAVSHFTLAKGQTIPVPDSSRLLASGNALTPTLSWSTIAGYAGNLFYRARVYTESGTNVWTSDRLFNTTSVTVPSGILSSGTNYKWRMEAWDNFSFANSDNRANSQTIALNIDNSKVYGTNVAVYKNHKTDGTFSLVLSGRGGGYQSGMVVHNPLVTGPNDFRYRFKDEECSVTAPYQCTAALPYKSSYADGLYTFSTTNDSNNSTTVTHFYFNSYDVPLLDSTAFRAYGDALAPTLTWAVPEGVDRPLYYVAFIFDSSNNIVWSSGWTTTTSVTVPSGKLSSQGSYHWNVIANDSKYLYSSNRSISSFKNLTIETSSPAFQYAIAYNRTQPSGVFSAFDLVLMNPTGAFPESIKSLTVTGPDGFSYAFQPTDYDPIWNSYYHAIAGSPKEGLYTFTVTNTNDQSAVTHWYYQTAAGTIPALDETSFEVSGAPLAPTISWSTVASYPTHLYYRVRIIDEVGVQVYGTSFQPLSAQTVPSGKLVSGKTYRYRVDAADSPDSPGYNNRASSNYLVVPAAPTPPGKATLVSPSGSITANKPTYTWNAVSSAEQYLLAVNDSSGAWPVNTWYTAAQAGCSGGVGTCSFTPDVALRPGSTTWYIQTKNSAGAGPWSDPLAFTVSMKATLISPSGSISTNQPTYTWNAVSNANWYLLAVKDSTGAWPINTWYTAAQAGCSTGTGTCTLTPGVALAAGNAEWYIQTWNSTYGVGAWSDEKAFSVLSLTPGKATLISPSGTISSTQPTYTWNAVANAQYYLLFVNDSTESGPINKWYSAAEAGCGSGTGTCSVNPGIALAVGSGTWYVDTWNSYGFGEWSDPKAFTLAAQKPGTAILISPTGISTNKPTFSWSAVSNADFYLLAVQDPTGAWPINKWYSAAEADCGSGTGTCLVDPGIAIPTGNSAWYVRTWNSSGYGDWSTPMAFTVPSLKPGKATLISPSGASGTKTPTYTWNAVGNAEYYLIAVKDSSGSWPVNHWYSATDLGCGGGTGTCSINPGILLATGDCVWYVETANYLGFGPWSDPLAFSVP